LQVRSPRSLTVHHPSTHVIALRGAVDGGETQLHGADSSANLAVVQAALMAAEDAAARGGFATCQLTTMLQDIGVDPRLLASVMAPLLLTTLVRRVGVPAGHELLNRVSRAARSAVIAARAASLEGAYEALGIRLDVADDDVEDVVLSAAKTLGLLGLPGCDFGEWCPSASHSTVHTGATAAAAKPCLWFGAAERGPSGSNSQLDRGRSVYPDPDCACPGPAGGPPPLQPAPAGPVRFEDLEAGLAARAMAEHLTAAV
jgi:hypothetical protein